MKFHCEVKTIHGQADFVIDVEAVNQGVAQTKAIADAKANGFTPTGRVKALKLKD